MTSRIVVHGFETSNNIKVRVALGYKGINYEFRPVDPADRAGIFALSGQHLTPVLEHGGRVLFDSAAILRYLDANFRDTPRLFGTSRDEQWAIEDQEFFARTELARPMMEVVHTRVAGGTVDPGRLAELGSQCWSVLLELGERLAGREWLVGHRLSAADITAAAVVHRMRTAGVFTAPAGRDPFAATAAWRQAVLRYDAHLR